MPAASVEQVVGRVAHGADDHDEVGAGAPVAGDARARHGGCARRRRARSRRTSGRRAGPCAEVYESAGPSTRAATTTRRPGRAARLVTRAPGEARASARALLPSPARRAAALGVARAERDDRRAGARQAGPERPGRAGRGDELRQLRVDRRPVRLVEPVDGRAAEQVEATLARARPRPSRRAPTLWTASANGTCVGQRGAHRGGRERPVRDEQRRPQLGRRRRTRRARGRPSTWPTTTEPAEDRGRGVVGVALRGRRELQDAARSRQRRHRGGVGRGQRRDRRGRRRARGRATPGSRCPSRSASRAAAPSSRRAERSRSASLERRSRTGSSRRSGAGRRPRP